MKQDVDNFPDLEAAFEAVKGVLFGPLDAARVKLKFNEIVKDTKDKREQEMDPRTALGAVRADRALHDEIMAQLPEVETLLDDNQEKLDAIVDREKKVLWEHLERNGARLPDGRFAFKGKDKHGQDVVLDENFKPVTPEEAEGVDFTGKMTLDDYRVRRKPLDNAIEMAEPNRRDQVRVGEIRERNTDQNNPLSMEQKEADKMELGEIKERAQEAHRRLESSSPSYEEARDTAQDMPTAGATIVKPQL